MLYATQLILAKGMVYTINIIPKFFGALLVASILNVVMMFVPRFKKIGQRNLERAYPEKNITFRNKILSGSKKSLAHLLLDFARTDSIDKNYADKNFDFPFRERLKELKQQGVPVIYAMGHLGSFELMAHFMAVTGTPFDFIVRKFKNPVLDIWWKKRRERNGNVVIEREGGIRGVLDSLKRGREVAVLFDQNVKRDHAVFVPWFGMSAATTRIIGIAALKTKARVILLSMQYLGKGRYCASTKEYNFDGLYKNKETVNKKVELITQELSAGYEGMIRKDPGAWFWMHRRWKTSPEGMPEAFYD